MRSTKGRFILLFLGIAGSMVLGATLGQHLANNLSSQVKTQQHAVSEEFEWGTFRTYFQGETYGTKDVLTGVAVIKPGMEIHPPHQHAEEEYLMVTAGQGTWHLNGRSFAAQTGDFLYAAPWEVHGIKNTGTDSLTFVVWKWNSKGLPVPVQPATNE